MPELKVDESRMLSVAAGIEKENDRIRDDFQRLTGEIRRLDGAWDGTASRKAMDGFMKISASYAAPRQEAMRAHALHLRHAAGDYSDAEKKNVALAERFK